MVAKGAVVAKGATEQALVSLQGQVRVPGGEIHYSVFGDLASTNAPLIILHGGPGYPHYPLLNLSKLSDDRAVIFYDQLGCGKSSIGNPQKVDTSLWTIDRHVEELNCLVKELELGDFHILGHSWGSILAFEYYDAHPANVCSLILSSPCISIPLWIEDSFVLRKQLPREQQRALALGEQMNEFWSEEYLAAQQAYYAKHVCRLTERPKELELADQQAGASVYNYMWGPNEFTLTGELADYDRSQELKNIKKPVLFISGFHDEVLPESTAKYAALSRNARFVILENSSHCGFLEEPEVYLKVVREFLLSSKSSSKTPYLVMAIAVATVCGLAAFIQF